MADVTRDSAATQPGPTDATGPEPPKKFPKGIVLGKDGKPCRSCTSFAAWAAQTKSSLKAPVNAAPTTTEASIPTAASDCPPDVETLGRGSWTLLHSIAAQYPSHPTLTDQSNIKDFMRLFATLYPCWVCGEGLQKYMGRNPMPTESRSAFGTWLCEAHNEVNERLGKKTFDCSRWEERWRDGWKDGRCG